MTKPPGQGSFERSLLLWQGYEQSAMTWETTSDGGDGLPTLRR